AFTSTLPSPLGRGDTGAESGLPTQASRPIVVPLELRMTRLDQALVERRLCESREKAKRAIMAGLVRINSQIAKKPSDAVKPEDELALDAGEKYVSRGGAKLEHALRHFALNL